VFNSRIVGNQKHNNHQFERKSNASSSASSPSTTTTATTPTASQSTHIFAIRSNKKDVEHRVTKRHEDIDPTCGQRTVGSEQACMAFASIQQRVQKQDADSFETIAKPAPTPLPTATPSPPSTPSPTTTI